MNKKYFSDLAKFNIWANEIVFGWLQEINEEQWNKNVVSSFNSVAATSVHIAGAEKVWLDRWNNIEKPIFLSDEFNGSKSDLISIWRKASNDIFDFINKLNEDDFEKKLHFKRLNGDEHTMKLSITITHLLNHSTFHRGQLVTQLRQVGFTKVSSTDVITYFRNH
jgi:uncharacterized damage-inducible protein DinB